MTEPTEVLTALVAKMRAVKGLVAAVGHRDNISVYSDMYPPMRGLEEAVGQMPVPSILVALHRIVITEMQWHWQFSANLRTESVAGVYEAFNQFVNGIPKGEDVSLINCEIHPNFDPMDAVSLERAPQAGGAERWYIRFDLMEKSA